MVDTPLIYKPSTIFLKKDFKGQYCTIPFFTIGVAIDGKVGLCGCSGWMPTTIGNLFKNTIEELLSTELAVNIRRSIIDGTYQYCNEKTCGVINNTGLYNFNNAKEIVGSLLDDPELFSMPTEIFLAGDTTCNLSCPSCRTSVVKVSEATKKRNIELGQILANNLFSRPTTQTIKLIISTSGELFASPMLLNFVNNINLKDFPNIKLDIQTNGLLCSKNWHKLNEMQQAVNKVTITFDAAQANTYEVLRRGGTWPELINSMEFLSDKKKENGMKLHTRMVVQQKNYKEILEFYNLSKRYGADRIEYTRLTDWHTWSQTEFKKNDVFDPEHPEHHDAITQLKSVTPYSDVWLGGELNF
jgi:sulfatase maturation enzyme AslB (radical SAM superfamily)